MVLLPSGPVPRDDRPAVGRTHPGSVFASIADHPYTDMATGRNVKTERHENSSAQGRPGARTPGGERRLPEGAAARRRPGMHRRGLSGPVPSARGRGPLHPARKTRWERLHRALPPDLPGRGARRAPLRDGRRRRRDHRGVADRLRPTPTARLARQSPADANPAEVNRPGVQSWRVSSTGELASFAWTGPRLAHAPFEDSRQCDRGCSRSNSTRSGPPCRASRRCGAPSGRSRCRW